MWISAGEHDRPKTSFTWCSPRFLMPMASWFHTRGFRVHRSQEIGQSRRAFDRAAQRRCPGGPGTTKYWRGTTNTLLNFGEGKVSGAGAKALTAKGVGAIGYLGANRAMAGVHVPHDERSPHRHWHGCHHARSGRLLRQLEYARNRPQGRPITGAGKDAGRASDARIIEHADIKRMLLAQRRTPRVRWR